MHDFQGSAVTRASPEAEWPVAICLLGEFRLLKRGRPVTVRTGGKVEALLVALALRQTQGVSREALVGSLWPDIEPSLASQSLSTLLYDVRKLLADGSGGAAAPVLQSERSYRLNARAGVTVDVAHFEALATAGNEHIRRGDATQGMASYASAADLYLGDLQAGGDTYSLMQRERLRALYLGLLARLADHHYAAGDIDAAMRRTLQVLDNDPCREDAHRLAMRCFVRRGERAQALRQFRLCQQILRDEFGAPPEAATTALFDQVRLDPNGV